nr:DNA-directed RNA polymerases IV and V subunit 2-like [Tanacetum cinerariifolium]
MLMRFTSCIIFSNFTNAAAVSALERLRPLAFPGGGTHFKYGAAEYIERRADWREKTLKLLKSKDIRGVKFDRGVVDLIDADIEDGNIVNILIASIHAADQECDYFYDFRNKMLKLAGELLEREVKVHLRHAQKRIVKAMQRDLYLGQRTRRCLGCATGGYGEIEIGEYSSWGGITTQMLLAVIRSALSYPAFTVAQPLEYTTAPGGEEPTSRCQTFSSMRALGEDQPVKPRVTFIR